MRAARPLADPAQVLLDRVAMAGQPRPLGPWPAAGRRRDGALVATGLRPPCRASAAPDAAPGATTIPSGIRDGRVEQLDLEPDDRMQADGLGRADEADRAVQPGVVRDGQPGQPQLDGPLDQVVRRARRHRGTRSWCGCGVRRTGSGATESLRSGAGDRGQVSIEHLF